MSAMAAWAVYCVLVAALLGAAAWAGESALRRLGRAGRWAWLGALAGSLVVPAAVYWLPTLWQRPGPGVPDAMVVSLPALAVAAPSAGWSAGRVLLVVWLVASSLVVAYAVFSLVRLALARRGWRRAEVEGVSVYVSGDVGPAVFAAGRTSIVVPEWALELDDRFRRLMLLHEAEHARAGDPVLLLFALGLVAAMPWNPVLWWQLRRLRMAVEVDCDARVVAATGDARLYGSLLIEVGRRRSGARLVVAFSEPRSFLERRIRAIVRGVRGRGVRRALAPAIVGAVALFAAVCARDPASPGNPMDAVIAERPEAGQDISAAPVFTPMTVPPRILNQREVEESLSRNYPPLLKEAGIGGTTTVWLFVDEQGRTGKTQINQSSGQRALDDAALRVAGEIEVSAALNGDRPVPVWISVPITFTTGGAAAERPRAPVDVSVERLPTGEAVKVLRERGDRPGEASDTPPAGLPRKQSLEELAKAPTFTPMTVPPRITNQKEVEAALSRNYPPLLRDAGIGGTATVWFFIDENGRVVKTQLNQSSGYDALDEAALRVAGTIEVSAARNRTAAVPVWVSIPITFTTQERRPVPEIPRVEAPVRRDVTEDPRTTGAIPPPTSRDSRTAPTFRPGEVPGDRRDQGSVDIAARPVFTPMTVPPRIRNQTEVETALTRNYPPLLRDAGISGTAIVWFFIDENGRVVKRVLDQSSGYQALDEAALRVAETIEVTPALNRDQRVPVWVSIPITFTVK